MDLEISYKGKLDTFHVEEDCTLSHLHDVIHTTFKIAPEHQKLISKGVTPKQLCNKDLLVKDIFCKKNKIILMGTEKAKIDELQSKPVEDNKLVDDVFQEEKWEEQEKHRKIISSGIPSGVPVSVDLTDWGLPKTFTHLRNMFGNKLRITYHNTFISFKTDVGSQDLPIEDIVRIESQKISSMPGYNIVLYKTEGNFVSKNCYVYFVPDGMLSFILKRYITIVW